ncbi:hypothetical protein NBRC116494_22800 [Aurantivibrio plasticivorans]
MTTPLIAVATNEDGTVSPHAGRAETWKVYAVEGDKPEHVWDIHVDPPGSLHEWHVRGDGNRHPVHGVDVAIAGSAGEGVTRRLAERDTQLVTTAEKNPEKAVIDYLEGNLAAGLPHEETECLDPEHHAAVSAAGQS